MLHCTCVFASGGICLSRSEFWCVRGVKCRRTIFCDRVDRYSFHKKGTGTRYSKLVFLHWIGSAFHVVNFGASGARSINALFFKLRWPQYRFDKKRAGTSYSEHLFLYPMGSVGHVVHSGASGA
jgi:hypothetical protein